MVGFLACLYQEERQGRAPARSAYGKGNLGDAGGADQQCSDGEGEVARSGSTQPRTPGGGGGGGFGAAVTAQQAAALAMVPPINQGDDVVDRVGADVTVDDLVAKHLSLNRPVVIERGLLDAWPASANGKWTRAGLARHHASAIVHATTVPRSPEDDDSWLRDYEEQGWVYDPATNMLTNAAGDDQFEVARPSDAYFAARMNMSAYLDSVLPVTDPGDPNGKGGGGKGGGGGTAGSGVDIRYVFNKLTAHALGSDLATPHVLQRAVDTSIPASLLNAYEPHAAGVFEFALGPAGYVERGGQ